MKNLSILILCVTSVLILTQCNNSSVDKLCSNADSRGKVISELMNNDEYMMEVMDSMNTTHADAMVTASCGMMKGDKAGMQMMNSMMDMCKEDSSMCKKMMGKTMDMCDSDNSRCNMMLATMNEHPKSMQSMMDMGMCNTKGVIIADKKDGNSQHHMK